MNKPKFLKQEDLEELGYSEIIDAAQIYTGHTFRLTLVNAQHIKTLKAIFYYIYLSITIKPVSGKRALVINKVLKKSNTLVEANEYYYSVRRKIQCSTTVRKPK